jgi:hypothetical protein
MSKIPPREFLLPLLAQLRAKLAELHPDVDADEDLLTNVLDGETPALDVLRTLCRRAVEVEMMSESLATRVRELKQRRDRFDAEAEACRTTVRDGLEVLGIRRLEDAELTASLRPAPARVLITNIAAVPDLYKRIEITPRLLAIGKELRAGEVIPGAELSNSGPPVLAIVRS